MPNYKDCRMCPEKFVPIGDERICPNCEADIQRAVSMPAGQPVVAGTMTDADAVAMRAAVEDALPEPEVIEDVAPVIETIVKETVPTIPIPDEIMPDPQVEKEIVVVEEAIVELDKGEDAEVIKEEIIAPSAPKPEEKPDAPG